MNEEAKFGQNLKTGDRTSVGTIGSGCKVMQVRGRRERGKRDSVMKQAHTYNTLCVSAEDE